MLNNRYIALLIAFLSLPALAQDERFIPKPVPPSPDKPALEVEQPEKPADTRDAVLVESLNGLMVTSAIEPVSFDKTQTGDRIVIDNLDVPDPKAFVASLEPFIGEPVSLALLDRINRHIVSWYRSHDYPVVDALAPGGQDITEGNVQISVLVGLRGDVTTQGGRYFDNDDLVQQFRVQEGDYLRYSILQEELDWANRNPFRSVNLQLAAGEKPGFTDLNLLVQDRLPVRVYAGVEDTGNRYTGKRRWLLGANWGNAFGLGHQLGYQFISADNPHRLSGHSFSYLADFASRHTLSAYASYIDTRPDLDANLKQGSSTTSAGFTYQMPLLAMGAVSADWSLGYAYLRSNSNLEFGGQEVFDNDYEVSQFLLGATGEWLQQKGSTRMGATLHLSPGSMMANNDDQAFEASRDGASANYLYLSLNASHRQLLPAGLSTVHELRGQLASTNLVSSEQFGLGGYASIRGYDEYALIGDHGLLLRNELRIGGWNPVERLFSSTMPESLQGLVFFDIGMASVKKPLPGETRTQNLRSMGVGFRYQLSHYVTARFDYGWQLKALPGESRDHRGHFSLVVSY